MQKIICFAVIITAGSTFLPAAAQYTISRSAFSNGAAISAADSSVIRGALGQSVTGVSSDSSHVSRIGFYYAAADLVTAVEPVRHEPPGTFRLEQNYPNPFNPRTTIQFSLPRESEVRLVLYDLRGRRISVLTDEFYQAGTYRILFSADNIPSGVYICRMEAGQFSETKRLLLLK